MNAKEEILQCIKPDGSNVIAATITLSDDFGYPSEDDDIDINLMVGFSDEDFREFLDKLDFVYDSGYGSQELYGVIFCTDGLWWTRGEYDGSEWWQSHRYPDMPDKLIPKS